MGLGRIARVVVGVGLLAVSACSANSGSNEASVAPLVVRSGSAMVMVGGGEAEALVQQIDGGVGIEAAGLTLAVTGFSGENDGRFVITREQAIEFKASGLQAGSTAEVWAFSTPRLLGTIEADGRGRAEGAISLPEEFEVGQHQLQLRGFYGDGASLVVALNVVVDETPGSAPQQSQDNSAQQDTPPDNAPARTESPESSANSESPSPNTAQNQAEQARQAAERAAAERAEDARQAAAERAEQERQAAEARAKEERQAAGRAAAEAQAAQRAESAAREEVLAAARIAAAEVAQQEANIWAADAEQYCRDRAMDIRVANSMCPGRGQRAGEEHYATMIGPITAAVEAEYMALYYFNLYDRYYRQFLSEAGY